MPQTIQFIDDGSQFMFETESLKQIWFCIKLNICVCGVAPIHWDAQNAEKIDMERIKTEKN